MAEEEGGGDGGAVEEAPQKCPECPPGLPGWMATFSDLVTLLLTFFVLLLSFAKTETEKYSAALGSVRDAFGGNVLKMGQVIQPGRTAENFPTMLESQQPVKPFPIEFLTMEGILDKYEINRFSKETLQNMKDNLSEHDLNDSVTIHEMPEGIQVRIKDRIYFKKGTVKIQDVSIEIFEKMIKLLTSKNWTIFVEGHASRGEKSVDGSKDALLLSSLRAMAVTRALVKRGVRPQKISTVYYGDTRPAVAAGSADVGDKNLNRRVEFLIRKTDLRTPGHKVDTH